MFDSVGSQRNFDFMNVGSNKQEVKGILIFSMNSLPSLICSLFGLCSGSMRSIYKKCGLGFFFLSKEAYCIGSSLAIYFSLCSLPSTKPLETAAVGGEEKATVSLIQWF